MSSLMQIDIVSSEEQIFSGQAQYLIAPSKDGEIGIFPRHISLITKLKPGILRVKLTDSEIIFVISGGFLEVHANTVTVLADMVERTDQLDQEKLIQQKEIALTRIKEFSNQDSLMVAKAYASLELAIAQLKALDYIKKHSKRA